MCHHPVEFPDFFFLVLSSVTHFYLVHRHCIRERKENNPTHKKLKAKAQSHIRPSTEVWFMDNGDDDKKMDQTKAILLKQDGLVCLIITFSRKKKILRTSSNRYSTSLPDMGKRK